MTEKKKPEPDDPEQSKRFVDAARAAGADESGESFKRAVKTIASSKAPEKSNPGRRTK